jgi:hypothetical protein
VAEPLSWFKQLKFGVPHSLRFLQRVRLRFLRANSATSFRIECTETTPQGKVKPRAPFAEKRKECGTLNINTKDQSKSRRG